MEGAGCYEDFNTVCKYVKGKPSLTDVDISHVYQDYIFSGCKKSDNCAKKEFDSFVGTDYIGENVGASSVKMFAANYTSDFSFSYKCQYDNKRASIPLFPKLTVNVKGICIAATDFINRPFNSSDWFLDEMEKKSNKSCEENVGFICSINNGEAVKIGFGCYEDFQFACNETIPSNISRNTRNFHYSDENLVILSCSEHYLCAEVELNRYLQVLSRTSSPIVKANPKSSTNCTFEVRCTIL
uniref:Uncharacterized protein n=1 Tax=Panagrolaimus sp. PS1159 TaxID=55785 RepID=A0AC35F4R3_9BILA